MTFSLGMVSRKRVLSVSLILGIFEKCVFEKYISKSINFGKSAIIGERIQLMNIYSLSVLV